MGLVVKFLNYLFNMKKQNEKVSETETEIEAPAIPDTGLTDNQLVRETVVTNEGEEVEVEYFEKEDDDVIEAFSLEVDAKPDTSNKNDYKSKIEYWVDVNKPIMAIFFGFFNQLSHKRLNENTPIVEGIKLRGIFDRDNRFVDNVTDFPPTLFDYTVIFQLDNNEIAFYMQAFKENGAVRNVIRMSSADITHTKSYDLYNKLFKQALDSSNLKGSYMTMSDNKLEWKVRELKDLSFEDVFLPRLLMEDLETYTKLFDTRKILQRYMFSGIPGTGKTESTRAISKLLNKKGVTIIKTNICEVIKQKFELASILAPSLIILDDIDLYLGDRNHTGVSALLGQFLDILDGVDKLPSDVGVIASTNAPHLIDLAAQRPGRFNKLLFFDDLTEDNIKSIIIKSLTSMNQEFDNVTEEDVTTLTDNSMIKFFKKEGSTGAFIYEAIKNIKHKEDILSMVDTKHKLNLKNIIEELKTNSDILDKKLRARTIKNKLSSNTNGISF
jgi:AAA+ superfamily predicted ATPase